MHRTRCLLQKSSGFAQARQRKTILPRDTFWDVTVSGLQGLWATFTDQSAHERYEQLIRDGVIQDSVLAKARNGSLRTLALFWNLQNPLFQQNNFDPKEFVQGVGPALEVFQDTLGQLVQQMNSEMLKEKKDSNSNTDDDETSKRLTTFGLLSGITGRQSENEWRKQAEQDPNSLAARLQKIVSENGLDDHYFGAKLFQILVSSGVGAGGTYEYVAGSSAVQSVALINARAMETIDQQAEVIDSEHPEFAASEGPQQDPWVAARLEVLYEIVQTYRPSDRNASSAATILSSTEQYKKIQNDASLSSETTPQVKETQKDESVRDHANNNANIDEKNETSGAKSFSQEKSVTSVSSAKDGSTQNDVKKEQDLVSETSLAVAVIEGWLRGGPNKQLRWKISMIREAYEFA